LLSEGHRKDQDPGQTGDSGYPMMNFLPLLSVVVTIPERHYRGIFLGLAFLLSPILCSIGLLSQNVHESTPFPS
jgi:hypothetical protein